MGRIVGIGIETVRPFQQCIQRPRSITLSRGCQAEGRRFVIYIDGERPPVGIAVRPRFGTETVEGFDPPVNRRVVGNFIE